jgi:argininosuccinate lyase
MALDAGEDALRVVIDLTRAVLDALTFAAGTASRPPPGISPRSPDLADALVREADLPFRLAHEVCATLVRGALEVGRRPAELTAAAVNALASARAGRAVSLTEESVRSALDPVASVARRTVLGGPAPETVRAMVAEAQHALAREREALRERHAAVDRALGELAAACEGLSGG